ncbi:hypothetical protein EMCRGX_G008017 [Ephydatia muelleri]
MRKEKGVGEVSEEVKSVHLSSNNAKHQNTGAKTLHSALRAQNMKHNQCSKKETVKQKIIVDVDAYQVNEASTLDEDWWIEELNLLHTEKEIIVSGKWLSEPIITAGQVILAKQFKHVWNGAGFQEVGCSFTMSFNIEICKFIQILHDPAGHWKPFQEPYRSANDFRLKWLQQEFLPYLNDWEESVNAMNCSKKIKKCMMLSAETQLGIRITVASFVELVNLLFTLPGVTTFLSERLCQDPLEQFFGCQRQRGRTNDNPTVKEFCKNTQALRVVNSFCAGFVKGNCRGKRHASHSISEMDLRPLAKRPRTKSCT